MADAQKKADAMKKKSDEFHRLFTASDNETVIQDYSCMYTGVFGKLYISQNLLGFYSSFPERMEKIPFAKVTDVQKDRGTFFQGISITFDKNGTSKKCLFTNFSHRDEVYELVSYVWKNPPSYVAVDKDEENETLGQVIVTSSRNNATDSNNPFGNASSSTSTGSFGTGGSFGNNGSFGTGGSFDRSYRASSALPNGFQRQGDFGSFDSSSSRSTVQGSTYDSQQALATNQVKVDVEKAREALRIAYATRDVTGDTINKIEAQGQQLVRIEAHLDNLSANLEKSEKLIKGMESVFSYIGNKWSKNKDKPPPVVDYGNRAIKIEKMEPPLDIEILCKNPDDSFTPALLRFHTMGFACVDPQTGKPLAPTYHWPYTDLAQLVLRARHEHMDIKFTLSSGKDRFRLMSSYLQLIVNEIVLRAPEGQVQVTFEPGVKKFEYNNPALSKIPPVSRAASRSGFSRAEANIKTSALLSANADQQIKDDLDEVDRHLDEVTAVVGDINDMALAMGHELTLQNEHLDRIDRKVADNNDKLQGHTRRMNKLMS